jgi:glutaredoxin
MPNARGAVSGAHSDHQTVFYGLSTCIWCKRTRKFLEEQGVSFEYIYVDLLKGQERKDALAQVRRWNPAESFPTVVVDNAKAVVGLKEEMLKEALGL